jgi:ribose 5-phosphate isomerase B
VQYFSLFLLTQIKIWLNLSNELHCLELLNNIIKFAPVIYLKKDFILKIAVAADHGGFELKKKVVEQLKDKGFEVLDLGNNVYDPLDDYPDFAHKAAMSVSTGEAERAVIICGSGVGACVAANKTKGVRASVCHDFYSAHQGVEHDDMNVLCLGARIVGEELAKELVDAFVSAKFINSGKYLRRLDKVNGFES